ncbi:MAG: shikimate kinase AroK [Gammaproteobacteria bacterium]|nr:shikimate kinase AroK [Gammaproteobacteria bacterium]
MTDKTNIFLIGPMGAGKSSVGKLLAKCLDYDFFDSDQVIEEQTGADIPWIFDIEGEEGFRLREIKAIETITQKNHIVLATGGGVVLKEENRLHLKASGQIFYLYVSLEEQLRRTSRSRTRPLILNKNAREAFERLKNEREPLYFEIADHVIDTNHGSIKGIVDSILEKL